MPDSLPTLTPAELARYSRHILLEELGLEGQRRIKAARVLIVGAGGLGSPAALYLAAAGIGTLGVADLDRVETHNLQRQLLHDDASVGEAKVASAARRLRTANPLVQVVTHEGGVTPGGARALFAGYDVIVDGTDNFTARYLNNDAAFFARRPLVYGSVFKFSGQVAVFDPGAGGPCYRCLFPAPPPPGTVPACGEAGVLGALCGVIGSLQALEAIKLVTGVGEPLRGRLLNYDALDQQFQTLQLARDRACPLCGDHPVIREVPPTEPPVAATGAQPEVNPDEAYPLEISVQEAKARCDAVPRGAVLLDVREAYELDICRVAGAVHIPLREIPDRLASLPRDRHLLVLCHVGARSLRATLFLRANGFSAVSNIAGGIRAWAEEVDPALARY